MSSVGIEELATVPRKNSASNASPSNGLKIATTWPYAYILLTGLIVVGQYSFWSYGLVGGFGNYLVAMALVAVFYVCLSNSLSELSSILPFAGGTYGYVRITHGIFSGYLIGCSEIFSYFIFAAATYIFFGNVITIAFGTSIYLEPLYWVILSAVSLLPMMQNTSLFWLLNAAAACVSLVFLAIYMFSCLSLETNISKNSKSDDISFFEGGLDGFFFALPPASLLYLGVEIFPLMSEDVLSPKESIPKGMMLCMYTVIATSIAVVLIVCATTPIDEAASISFPLLRGYEKMFDTEKKYLYVLLMPSIYNAACGFQFAYSRVIFAMARSGSFNQILGVLQENRRSPIKATFWGTIVMYILVTISWFFSSQYSEIYNAGIVSSFCVYFSVFFSFLVFRYNYEDLERKYWSQTGVLGALFGGLLSIIMNVAVIVTGVYSALGFLFFLIISSIYYYFVARSRQVLSAEEINVMMVAHVIKANRKAYTRKKNLKKLVSQKKLSDRSQNDGKAIYINNKKVYVVLPEITLKPLPVNEESEQPTAGVAMELGVRSEAPQAREWASDVRENV